MATKRVSVGSIGSYFESLTDPLDAARMETVIPGQWDIANGLHRELDVAFGEDGNRTRDQNAGANLGVVRRAAVSLLKQDPKRGGFHGNRFKAALNEHYLEQVLQGFKAIRCAGPGPQRCG